MKLTKCNLVVDNPFGDPLTTKAGKAAFVLLKIISNMTVRCKRVTLRLLHFEFMEI